MKPLKQTKIDDYAAPPSPVFPLVVQLGGSNVEHGESWTLPKQIESSINGKAVTYRKEFDTNNKHDLVGRMEKLITTFRSSIEVQLSKLNAIKYYFTLRMIFHQSKDNSIVTDPPVSFRSEVFTALNSEKLYLHTNVAMKQFNKQIDEFKRNGSGWVINHFINLDIGKLFSFYIFCLSAYIFMNKLIFNKFLILFRCCSI